MRNLRRAFELGAIAILLGTGLISGAPVTDAQSPYPNANFLDVSPGSSYPSGYQGVVVEGLGSNSCSYSLSSLEQSTVNFLNTPQNTITELSPQSYCASISQYESMISSLINYVNSHASNAGNRWGGIMLDEEAGSASDCSASGFGFTASQIQTLNNYVYNAVLSTPGIEWFYTEDFTPQGCWGQSTYDNIVANSYLAPQIPNSNMVSLANGSATCCQMVTWSSGYPYPYNSESASVNPINGSPFTEFGFNWANRFQGV